MITRRDALIALPLLGAAALAGAQAPKSGRPKRYGILALSGNPYPAPMEQDPYWMALRKKGWILGDNLLVEPAFAGMKAERLAGLAEERVRKRVDVIETFGADAAMAAACATQTIPILFSGVLLPVEQGLIDSFGRPGRNLTGQAIYTGLEVSLKRLEYLRQIAPEARRLAWLWRADLLSVETVAGSRIDVAALLDAGVKGLGFESRFFPFLTPQDLDAAFDAIAAWRAQALNVAGATAVRKRIAEFALRHRLPSGSFDRVVEPGELLSYGGSESESDAMTLRFAEFADRILRGASPAGIAVERPSRYELVINLKTAKALGLTIPPSLLARADEVIQ